MISKRQLIINGGVFGLFILLGIGIYFNSLHNGFHYDDRHHIVQNPYIQNPGNILHFFTDHRTFSTLSGVFRHYRPLLLVSYAVNYYFGKLDPMGYHLVNLGFHIGSAFLLFLIIGKMVKGVDGSFFSGLAAGLLFLTTPFNSEVVNYITARSSVMVTFFCLLSFYFWVRFRSETLTSHVSPLTSYVYIASLLAFLLGMLTKEIAITLPVMLLLYDLYFNKISIRTNYRAFLPYFPFAISGIFIGIIMRFTFFKAFQVSSVSAIGGMEQGKGFITSFVIGVRVLAKYFYTMIVPVQLSIWHKINDTFDIYILMSCTLIIGLLVLAYLLWRRSDQIGKTLSFFMIWFFVTLLPLTLVSLNVPYQENRGHMAAAGVIGALGILLGKLRAGFVATGFVKGVSYALLGVMTMLYSAGTVTGNQVWQNDLTLWSNVIADNPQSTDARIAIGDAHMDLGDLDAAESEYQVVLKTNPGNSAALSGIGIIHYKRNELNKSLDFFLKAKEIDPFASTINVYLAKIYREKGDMPSAAKHLLLLIGLSPHNPTVYQELVEVYAKMGELEKVYKMAVRAIGEDPNNPGAQRALGLIYMYHGKLGAAQGAFEKVLSSMPYNQDVLLDLGYIYASQGMFVQSEEMFKKMISLSPDDPEASQALANVYQRQGRLDEALALYQIVLDKNPGQFNSFTNLGLLYFSKRETVPAIDALGKALSLNPNDYAARFNLARVYESQGKKELARKELRSVLMMTSGNSQNREIYEVAQRKLADLK